MNPALDTALKVSFYAGLIASLIFVVLYGFRSAWRESSTGRAIMALMSIIAVSYSLGAIALVWPALFRNDYAVWIALVLRSAIAITLINMTAVLIRAQSRERHPYVRRFPNDRDPEATDPGRGQSRTGSR